ncbi:integrating conjugative element protein, PFL_4695 family [Legionella busanensis]|uniref:Integrating conjugative element protein, PFL_4695 family n=1 Tax=Legionella busanensis TaxID=190655 RepID=A0A378KBL6_9GAMM|nr:integrating conjugative element protein [Legionella busanensis]STX81563.1 integrating conjugative element protein, PFL_4695 family [Legionella busanensis]
MRVLAVVSGSLLIGSAYGLNVLEIQGPVKDIKPYLAPTLEQTEVGNASNQPSAFGAPMISKASPGAITAKTLPHCISISMLVIGNDTLSKQWLSTHQDFLKQFHGLGLVANVDTQAELVALELLAGIPLMAANVDVLMGLIHQAHYPLVIERGRVWQ